MGVMGVTHMCNEAAFGLESQLRMQTQANISNGGEHPLRCCQLLTMTLKFSKLYPAL